MTDLSKMTHEQLDKYLEDEVESIIQQSNPRCVLKLRVLQARMNGIRRRVKDPYHRAYLINAEMKLSIERLRDAFNGIIK
jgi:hypothetical protein